jgi:hypothetical protein
MASSTRTPSTFSAGWENPSNAATSNDTYAVAGLDNESNTESPFLIATNFGFEIPLFSSIDGIVCSYESKAEVSAVVKLGQIYIYKNNTQTGNNEQSQDSSAWDTSDSTHTYGSPSYLWQNSWTPQDINNAGTGFGITAEFVVLYGGPTTSDAYVDAMSMTVYYTLEGLKFGATSILDIYQGTNKITKAYLGSSDISTQ